MLYFPTSIQYHDEHKDKTVLAWHSKMKGRGLEQNSRTTLSVSMLLSLYACKSASPEDLSARIVERKYVLIFHVQLDDRSRVAVATGVVSFCLKIVWRSVPQNRLRDRLRLADDFSIKAKNPSNRSQNKTKTGRSPRPVPRETFLLTIWQNKF